MLMYAKQINENDKRGCILSCIDDETVMMMMLTCVREMMMMMRR